MKKKNYAYVSCWKHPKLGGATGMGIYTFDPDSGVMNKLDYVYEDTAFGPAYWDNVKNILYACNETENLPGFPIGGGGRIIAFKSDPETGALSQIDEIATLCPNPTYIAMTADRRYMVVANHSSHNAITKAYKGEDGKFHCSVSFDDSIIDLIEIKEDGSFGEILDIAYHYGSGKTKPKAHPHPHCAVFSPSENFFVVCDKGNDKVYSYKIDRNNNKIVQCCAPFEDKPGSSPRYCCFNPNAPYLYVNHESKTFVSVFKYDESGNLSHVQDIETIPESEERPRWGGQSGILCHPSGDFVYSMMTTAASVAVFKVNNETGRLDHIQYLKTEEKQLRSFQFSPDGKFLVTTSLMSGTIETYSVETDGLLLPVGKRQVLPGAAYITFVER